MTTDQQELAALCDRRLHRLLGAAGAEVDREIERLILTEVRPVMTAILGRYGRSGTLLHDADIDDLAASIDLRMLETLRAIHGRRHDVIHDLRRYSATLTYNTINAFLRKQYPQRARLKNRVRYALTNDERLALWIADVGPAGGLRRWSGSAEALDQVPPATTVERAVAGESHAGVLVEVFAAARRPVLVEALVDFLQQAWNMPGAAAEEPLSDDIPADVPDGGQRAQDLNFARALWSEIRELRPLQRKALLLNLRYDGDLDILPLLILSGVATLFDLAAALELSKPELVALWKQLPLEDSRIAELLGVTRQQVINLRKSARERLSRRLPR